MIANDEGSDEKLDMIDVFESPEDGNPIVKPESRKNIIGLTDNQTKIFPRKEEVQEILRFLKDDNKVLLIAGPQGVRRTQTISKAIKFAVDHDYETVIDGAYYIDLTECESINAVCMQLGQIPNLIIQPDMNKILHDSYLRERRCVLVFSNLQLQNEKLVSSFIRFLNGMNHNFMLNTITILDRT